MSATSNPFEAFINDVSGLDELGTDGKKDPRVQEYSDLLASLDGDDDTWVGDPLKSALILPAVQTIHATVILATMGVVETDTALDVNVHLARLLSQAIHGFDGMELEVWSSGEGDDECECDCEHNN